MKLGEVMPGRRKDSNRDLAAVALAAGQTFAEAATVARVSERTVLSWNTDPAFRDRVNALRHEMLARACGTLADTMSAATKRIRELVDSATENIALRAASAIIDHTVKVTGLVDLQKRVEELERVLAAKEAP